MKSMTGFGTSLGSNSFLNLEISIKSINGRFFDARFHLPREYFSFEAEMKKEIVKHVRRGSLDIYVQRRVLDSTAGVKIVVNRKLVGRWMKAYRDLAQAAGVSELVSLETLAAIPNVLQTEGEREVNSKEKSLLFSQLKRSLQNLEKERQREGLALRKDIEKHLQGLGDLAREMEKLRLDANGALLKKMESRLKQANLTGQVDEVRLSQEVAIIVDRADIGEEIARLREHLIAFAGEVERQGCEGKKLDFYSQELLREVNTIGSKSQVIHLTHLVVDAKTHIEKIREQVQNVE
ncbi:MAG: YicC family protein [Bdellovibrionales bacterium]|nr:YicC family protein [Bdellovibrionales bacterium]